MTPHMRAVEQQELIELRRDAARYRYLREQHWSGSKLCVVLDPKKAVKLGYVCPHRELLDLYVDEEMKETPT